MTNKSQSKFAAGDKVVCNEQYPYTGEYFMFKGREYVVSKCDEHFVEFEGKPNYRYLVKSFDLVQAAFANMKFCVNSPEHSKEIQEALFEMGYKWYGRNPTVPYIADKVKYIYASDNGNISHDDSEYRFNNQHANVIETAIETTKSYKLIPVVAPKTETIEIDGKTYDKEALLKRLAELEVV